MSRARTTAGHDPAALRARLKALILADGRTSAAIADAAGMSPAQLWQVLNGVRANPSTQTTGRLLEALGLPWAALDRSGEDSRGDLT